MEQIGGLVVGGARLKRRRQLRVEQVCWTEGRSSRSLGTIRALLRVGKWFRRGSFYIIKDDR